MPIRIDPSVEPISRPSGTMPRKTSFSTTIIEACRSSSGTGGPSFGLMKLRTSVYTMYMPASRNPGPNAAA